MYKKTLSRDLPVWEVLSQAHQRSLTRSPCHHRRLSHNPCLAPLVSKVISGVGSVGDTTPYKKGRIAPCDNAKKYPGEYVWFDFFNPSFDQKLCNLFFLASPVIFSLLMISTTVFLLVISHAVFLRVISDCFRMRSSFYWSWFCLWFCGFLLVIPFAVFCLWFVIPTVIFSFMVSTAVLLFVISSVIFIHDLTFGFIVRDFISDKSSVVFFLVISPAVFLLLISSVIFLLVISSVIFLFVISTVILFLVILPDWHELLWLTHTFLFSIG